VRFLVEASNATVGVDAGRIVPPDGRFDLVLRIPDGELRPGLVNAHEHLHRNHYGRLGHPPYANAYEWGRDIHARDATLIGQGRLMPRRAALLHGAWKNLLAGVTTVVHHDVWELDFAADFPLRVARIRHARSLGFEPPLPGIGGTGPFAIHLAEGTDGAAAAEVRDLDARGLLTAQLLAVHVVGADDDGVRRLRAANAAIVWCPTSNEFLFGRTASAALLDPGVDVLLGSDSLLTGAGTLLDELRHARALGLVSDDRLEAAVGSAAARRLGLAPPSLDVGAAADLVALRRPLLEASARDVAAVIAKGVPRVLDPTLAPSIGPLERVGRLLPSGGVVRWVLDQDPRSIGGGASDVARHVTAPESRRLSRAW
jgi:cytosine/adenosine deaminase-related metal-dependent hydrolase